MKRLQQHTGEVWVIQLTDGWLLSYMDEDPTTGFMAWKSKAEATAGLKFQIAIGYLGISEGKVVRLAVYGKGGAKLKEVR